LKEVVATLQKKAQEKPRKTPLSSMAIAQFAQKIIIIKKKMIMDWMLAE